MIPKSLVAASLKPFILSVLTRGPIYGYEIIQRVHGLTDGDISWTTSTLYPVLHKLENEELLESFWEEVDQGYRAKKHIGCPRLFPTHSKGLNRGGFWLLA